MNPLARGVALVALAAGAGLAFQLTQGAGREPVPREPAPAQEAARPVAARAGAAPAGAEGNLARGPGTPFDRVRFLRLRAIRLWRAAERAGSDAQSWAALGETLFAAGRLAEAREAFERALRLAPGDREIRETAANLPGGTILYGAALATALRARLAEEPENDELWGDLGDALLASGDPDAAVEAYRRAAEFDPRDDEWQKWLTDLGASGGGEAARVARIEALLRTEPGNDEIWGDLGDARLAAGDVDGAREAYRRAHDLEPDDWEWYARLRDFHEIPGSQERLAAVRQRLGAAPEDDEAWGDLGDDLAVTGDPTQALDAYRRAAALDPDDDEWPGSIERVKQALAEGPARAQELGERLAADPQDGETWGKLGETLRRSGDVPGAIESFRRATALDPGNNDWREAIADLGGGTPTVEEASARALADPGFDERWGDLGDAWLARGEITEARRAYERALDLDPGDSEWQEKTRRTGARWPALERRISDLSARTELDPRDDERWGDLGDTFLATGNVESAAAAYARAHEEDPDDDEWRGRLLLLRGRLPDAPGLEDRLRERIERKSGSGDTWGLLGEALLRAGRTPEARSALERAAALTGDGRWIHLHTLAGGSSAWPARIAALRDQVARRPDDDELWGDLGDALSAAGDRWGALEAYRRAAALDPQDTEWPEKISGLEQYETPPSGSREEELAGLARHLETDPLNADTYERIEALGGTPPSLDTLIEGVVARLRAAPLQPEGWGLLGDLRTVLDDRPGAAAAYRTAFALAPADSAWLRALESAGERDPADEPLLEALRAAIERLKPEDRPAAWTACAEAHRAEGRSAFAEACGRLAAER